ncbi:MAG: hypothetical protein M0R70_04925 [Nitrospirae bacterium]|nr:hypothetical protein [Nitrospirota bacterium]
MDNEEHIKSLGTLVSYFHTLEFALRAVLRNHEKEKSEEIDYATLNVGDTVPEEPMTNYDSLETLIDKYNKLAEKELRIDKKLVAIRDAIAHGRVFSDSRNLPMKLLKFDKPRQGAVTVTFAATMDHGWFADKAVRLYEEIQKVFKKNE